MNKQYRVGDDILVKGIVNSEVSNGGIHVLHDGIDAFYSLDQIYKPQKPIIPQFVADWYEENKMDLEYNLYLYQISIYEETVDRSDFFYWMQKSVDPIKTLVNMHQFGYKIKQPQLYTVEIPNPNSISLRRTFLGKVESTGKIQLRDLKEPNELCKLTEKEIKEDFDWAWKFAKPATMEVG